MKQFIMFLMLIMTVPSVFSRESSEYLPILEDGKVWKIIHVKEWDSGFETTDFAEVRVKGDTIVDNVEAKVVSFMPLIDPSNYITRDYVLYEKDRVLSYWDDNYLWDWSPLLDFNYKKGGRTEDSIWDIVWRKGFQFKDEGSLLCQNTWRPYVQVEEGAWHSYWIEGIGSPTMLFLTVRATSPGDPRRVVSEVYLNDECIFSLEDLAELAGKPDIIQKEENLSTIYDLHGRVVANPQSGSVYIQNGKKFVAK